MFQRYVSIITFAIYCLICSVKAEEVKPLNVRFLKQKEDIYRYNYQYKLIEILLERTEKKFGPYELKPYMGSMESRRLNREAIKGKMINIMWSDAGHQDLDSEMIRIPFPILKGLLGYRIFFIKKEEQKKFSKIKKIEDLKKMRLGVGSNWGDIKIYQHNNFNITVGSTYEGLFRMLLSNRFDYFPRGINEIYFEYDALKIKYPQLHIEETILLYFRYPMFFYVSRTDKNLADRLINGLNEMQVDGSFDAFFFNYYRSAITQAGIKNRRVFYLDNPFMPEDLSLKKPELWFMPSESNLHTDK